MRKYSKSYRKNNEVYMEQARKYQKNHVLNPDIKKSRKDVKLRKTYGITIEQYSILLETQSGKCAICKLKEQKRELAVDHNHTTGKVRGLLCHKCNVSLGLLKESTENMESMISYVKRFL